MSAKQIVQADIVGVLQPRLLRDTLGTHQPGDRVHAVFSRDRQGSWYATLVVVDDKGEMNAIKRSMGFKLRSGAVRWLNRNTQPA